MDAWLVDGAWKGQKKFSSGASGAEGGIPGQELGVRGKGGGGSTAEWNTMGDCEHSESHPAPRFFNVATTLGRTLSIPFF